jgi:hypothetical protein
MFAPRPEIGKPDASHALRVRCGQKLVAIWAQINDFEMSPGDTETRSFSTSTTGLRDHRRNRTSASGSAVTS